MSRVLLVGGAGFIGHHLAFELRQAGHDVVAVDSLMINNLYTVDDPAHSVMLTQRLGFLDSIGVPLIRLDARDYNMLSETVGRLNSDVLVHLAAVAHMDRSNKTPYTTFDHSLRTLENALDVAVNSAIGRFVYFSSSTVYGNWPSEAVTEETPCDPKEIYGSLKLAGELMVRAYTYAKGLDHVIIRPSALYGPRCVSGRVLQRFIENARKGESLEVRSGGKLDFTYIKDLVRGTRLAIESDVANETFNLTYGEGRAVSEAAERIAARYKVPTTRNIQNGPEPERGTLDVTKARTMLGYNPEWPLERGLPDYMDWYER